MKLVTYVLLLIMLVSCGASDSTELDNVIDSALSSLTQGDCQSAIEELEEFGRQTDHALYLRVLASAYACRAGYSTTDLFTKFQDPLFTTALSTKYVGTFSAYLDSSKTMDDPQNQEFLDLQEAIDMLLYAGGIDKDIDPTMTRRGFYFGTDDQEALNAMIMYLTIVQLGKYGYLYANYDFFDNDASANDGDKGAGDESNICFANYDDSTSYTVSNIPAILAAGNTASCVLADGTTGSVYLGAKNTLNTDRMCQGVVLMNNFFHVMPSVIESLGGLIDLSAISSLESTVNTLKDTMATSYPASVEFKNVLSQSKCETLVDSDELAIEAYFIFVMEHMFL